ncbi:unnamed protein product [Arctia plantaginis]|uniref:Ty3 transposon capsid-like protein domain-containing protein n=1 Tax=Arctia plantaginis TaxID=874455 RepID=A0A8S1B3E7_ARCPL|nr:unnamed protein product [Arctia plantaginis]
MRMGSMASCTHIFDGSHGQEDLETFISAVSTFKTVEKIEDSEALIGIPLVLHGEAAIWWLGVKDSITTWAEFVHRLRNAFAPKKPAYVLYRELMGEEQPPDLATERFVAKKRMLFSMLPPPKPTETQQIDMIFDLLYINIRSHITRSTINTFGHLLEVARGMEDALREKCSNQKQDTSQPQQN